MIPLKLLWVQVFRPMWARTSGPNLGRLTGERVEILESSDGLRLDRADYGGMYQFQSFRFSVIGHLWLGSLRALVEFTSCTQ